MARDYETLISLLENKKEERKTKSFFYMKDAIVSIIENLEPPLFEPGYLKKISRLIEIFPDAVSRGFFLENVLNNDFSYPDIIIYFSNSYDVKKILAGKNRLIKIADHIFCNSRWKNIKGFWEKWYSRDSDFQKVLGMWLEFDTSLELAAPYVPSVFFRIDSNRYDNWITDSALRQLKGDKIEDNIKQNIEVCFESLPYKSVVSQIGIMLSRKSEGIRLYIKRLKKDALIPFLRKIRYMGDIHEAEKLCQDLYKFAEKINLQIEVGKTISYRVDFECRIDFKTDKSNMFLDWLKENSLCTEKNALILQNWTKTYVNKNPKSEILPVYMQKFVNHIKIVYRSSNRLTAKGYRGVFYA